MTINLFKREDRGEWWWFDFYYEGKRYRRRGGRTKQMAQVCAEAFLAKLVKGHRIDRKVVQRPTAPKAIKTVDFLAEQIEWLKLHRKPVTARRYVNVINHLSHYFQNVRPIPLLRDVKTNDLEHYLAWRSDFIAKKTIDDERIRIGMILKNAVNLEVLESNPAKRLDRIHTAEHPPDYYSPDELQRIFQAAEPRLRDVYITYAFTGMRKEELSNLEWTDIDMTKREIRVQVKSDWQPKNGQSRTIPMCDDVHRIILHRHELKESQRWVFTTPDGKPYRVNYPWRKLQTLLLQLGIKGHLHKFRHTYASMLVQQGVDLYRVKMLMGHNDITSTQIYAHLRPSDLHDAVAGLKLAEDPAAK